MAQQTTDLRITSTTQPDFSVVPKAPLWIKHLNLSPQKNLGAPNGKVPPGTPPNGSLRQIIVDDTEPALTQASPYTLEVTYDDVTFVVSNLKVV